MKAPATRQIFESKPHFEGAEMKPVFANAGEAKWGGFFFLMIAVIVLVAVGYEIHELVRWGLIMAGFGGVIVISRLVHGIRTGDWR